MASRPGINGVAALFFIAGVAGVGTVIAAEKGMDHSGMDHSKMGQGTSAGAKDAPYDARFLDTMTAHHRAAMEMAKMAQSKAQREEVKSLAKKIEDDSEKEIKQMQQWRSQWYGSVPPAMDMSMPGMSMMKDMPKQHADMNQANGEKFDQMFLQMMSQHHENGIKMARDAQTKASRPEVKELSKKIVAEQGKQVQQMKQMRTAKAG